MRRCQRGLPGGDNVRPSLKGLLRIDQDEADRKSIPAHTTLPPKKKKKNTQEGVLLTQRNRRRPWGWNLEITRGGVGYS